MFVSMVMCCLNKLKLNTFIIWDIVILIVLTNYIIEVHNISKIYILSELTFGYVIS